MIDVYDFMARGGTYKDVGSPEMVTDAVRREINTICVISSGNLSSSLLKEIRNRGLEEKIGFVNLVNQKPREKYDVQIPPRRILRNDAEREAWVRDQVSGAGIVKDYTDYIPESLRGVAEEILEGEPDFVSLGIGGGKLFLSLYNVIKQKGISTRLIGVVPRKDNGVFNDEKLIEEEGNLMFRGKIYGSVADKLATPYSHYKRALLEAMRNGHFIVEARNRDFVKANREAVKKGYEAEVSGSAGFTILDKRFVIRHDLPLTPESHVRVINTGKGKLNVIRRRKPLRKVLSTVATFVAGGILLTNYYNPNNLANNDWMRPYTLMMVDKSQFNKDALEFIGRGKDVEELRDNELNRLIALMVTDDFKDFEHASHGPEWSDFMNFRRTKYERNI